MKSLSKQKKVLIVVTSHNQMGATGRVTGYYLPEVSHPVAQLEAMGFGGRHRKSKRRQRFLVTGKKLTGFSNAEEDAAGLTDVMPFLLESKLVERGAHYSKADLWKEHVIVDQRLVTGQNPASAEGVGAQVARLIAK